MSNLKKKKKKSQNSSRVTALLFVSFSTKVCSAPAFMIVCSSEKPNIPSCDHLFKRVPSSFCLDRMTLWRGEVWLNFLQPCTQQRRNRSPGRGRKLCFYAAPHKGLGSPCGTSLCTHQSRACTAFR